MKGGNIMDKKEYYRLTVDSYGQPDGHIYKVHLTEDEFLELKKTYVYIYESYSQALWRAMA